MSAIINKLNQAMTDLEENWTTFVSSDFNISVRLNQKCKGLDWSPWGMRDRKGQERTLLECMGCTKLHARSFTYVT